MKRKGKKRKKKETDPEKPFLQLQR